MKHGKFLKIRCPRCRKIQIVFGRASTRVKCGTCNALIVQTSGGKARIKAEVREILWS